MKYLMLASVLLLFSCVSVEETQMEKLYANNEIREKIFRFEDEIEYPMLPPQKKERVAYPWEINEVKKPHALTAEQFLCKGSKKHPERIIVHAGQQESIYQDCGGREEHGVPEITPILLTLLNKIQEITGRDVIITSGHRCPIHQQYLYPGEKNHSSLYTMGAACDFYVDGLQHSPQTIIKIIQEFYRNDPVTAHDPSFARFHRIQLEKSHVITPWVNREICIIINTDQEGRNPDNAHDYPYISLLVHYDRATRKSIVTEWQELFATP